MYRAIGEATLSGEASDSIVARPGLIRRAPATEEAAFALIAGVLDPSRAPGDRVGDAKDLSLAELSQPSRSALMAELGDASEELAGLIFLALAGTHAEDTQSARWAVVVDSKRDRFLRRRALRAAMDADVAGSLTGAGLALVEDAAQPVDLRVAALARLPSTS